MDRPVTSTKQATSPAQDPPLVCTQALRRRSFHPGWSSCQDREVRKELYGGSDFISFQHPQINSSFWPRRKYESPEPASPGSKCPGFVVIGVLITVSSDCMGLHRLMLNSI